MNLYVRSLSTVYTGNIEIYLEGPTVSTPWPTLPTFAGAASPTNTILPWPRSPLNGDVIPFYAATNDGTGPQNVTMHTPSGASNLQVRLVNDGNGGYGVLFRRVISAQRVRN